MLEAHGFPPTPDHPHEYEALISILTSVLGSRKADYVSSPITTGKKFVQWFVEEGKHLPPGSEIYKHQLKNQVIKHNFVTARRFIEELRSLGDVVIEPTSFDVPHWTQNDYRHLWGQVIKRYVGRVFFVDGWEYSSGCAYEFWVAVGSGIVTLSTRGEPISPAEGARLMRAAVREIQAIGAPSEFLSQVLFALHEKGFDVAS